MSFLKRLQEKTRKLKLFFTSDLESYVQYSGNEESILSSKLGFFPLDYTSTLSGSLFEKFDEDGIPLKFLEGHYVYFHTKVFTYGLAHWNLYLRTGASENEEVVLKVCNYILNATSWNDGTRIFKEDVPGTGFTGKCSGAMEQGLGGFILSAGFEISADKRYLDAAIACVEPLLISENPWGIRVQLNDKLWFDEYPDTCRHVLNGHNDALIGLYAVSIISDIEIHRASFNKACSDLSELVCYFDRGWWSNYWYTTKHFNYIASMKYHIIHIYQLRYLGACSNLEALSDMSITFENYTSSHLNRIRALLNLAIGKVKMRSL